MSIVNENFLRLEGRYLFQEIAKRVRAHTQSSPQARIIRMGIGDVTCPLVPCVISAMHRAVDDLSHADTFRGYGPERGYLWLREAIAQQDYASRGVVVSPDEIYVSDGAKSDTGNITDLFSPTAVVGIPDPVYPVYVDTNVMSGRTVIGLPSDEANDFVPLPPDDRRLDIAYLCYPNNPTGAVITREALTRWVDYALRTGTIILYDSAYEAFIRDAALPHSIFEIEGARHCAIEFRSFSKTAGFTGVRCAYTVIPHELHVTASNGASVRLASLWERRQGCKFNGASYVSQRAAEAVCTPEGRAAVQAQTDHYLSTARMIRERLQQMGLRPCGGLHSPYIWAHTPEGMDSWTFFDLMLHEAGVVVTPGEGFGACGRGRFRLSAFADADDAREAMDCMERVIKN